MCFEEIKTINRLSSGGLYSYSKSTNSAAESTSSFPFIENQLIDSLTLMKNYLLLSGNLCHVNENGSLDQNLKNLNICTDACSGTFLAWEIQSPIRLKSRQTYFYRAESLYLRAHFSDFGLYDWQVDVTNALWHKNSTLHPGYQTFAPPSYPKML